MSFNLDSHSVDIPCRGCGKKISETLGRLKQNPRLTCRSCGAIINVDASEFQKTEQSIKKALDNIGKSFRKL